MADLKAKTNEIIVEMKELMDLAIGQIGADAFKHASTEEFELIQKSVKLYDSTMELAVMQAEMFEEMNTKLDRVLSMLEQRV